MKQLTKLKLQRSLNRRSNGVVEQIEKMLLKLAAWVKRLDEEQDRLNVALQEEMQKVSAAAEAEQARLEEALAASRQKAAQLKAETEREFKALIEESARESDKARRVQTNMQTLLAEPKA